MCKFMEWWGELLPYQWLGVGEIIGAIIGAIAGALGGLIGSLGGAGQKTGQAAGALIVYIYELIWVSNPGLPVIDYYTSFLSLVSWVGWFIGRWGLVILGGSCCFWSLQIVNRWIMYIIGSLWLSIRGIFYISRIVWAAINLQLFWWRYKGMRRQIIEEWLLWWRWYSWRWRRPWWKWLRLIVIIFSLVMGFGQVGWGVCLGEFYGHLGIGGWTEAVGIFIWTYITILVGVIGWRYYQTNAEVWRKWELIWINFFCNGWNLLWVWRPQSGIRWFALYLKILYPGRRFFNAHRWAWAVANCLFHIVLFGRIYLGLPIAIGKSLAKKALNWRWRVYELDMLKVILPRLWQSIETFYLRNYEFWCWGWTYLLRTVYTYQYGRRVGRWVHWIRRNWRVQLGWARRIRLFRYYMWRFMGRLVRAFPKYDWWGWGGYRQGGSLRLRQIHIQMGSFDCTKSRKS
jgi:hypothetical protein